MKANGLDINNVLIFFTEAVTKVAVICCVTNCMSVVLTEHTVSRPSPVDLISFSECKSDKTVFGVSELTHRQIRVYKTPTRCTTVRGKK